VLASGLAQLVERDNTHKKVASEYMGITAATQITNALRIPFEAAASPAPSDPVGPIDLSDRISMSCRPNCAIGGSIDGSETLVL
jgi:hypothetical protein